MITAILIEYDVDGVTKYLGVTDGNYRDTTGVSLEDGLWYPVLESAGNWSEQARHPYQEQGGELTIGDLVLQNDGTLDWLMDADIVGMKATRKQGSEHDSWGDMEQVYIARIAGRRFEGHSIVIELDNWLAKLAGPIYTETFDSDTPNPQLVGKQIPYVLGKVTQAPVLLYDANELQYYTAANASLIGEVAEGGNPTQKWALSDQPTFWLFGSPTLPITATFEGPSDTDWSVIIDDDLDTWVTGSDTALTSPYTSQGDRPDGWTLIVGDAGFDTPVDVTQDGGLEISKSGAFQAESTIGSADSSNAESVPIGSSTESWTDPENVETGASGSATISTDGSTKTDTIKVDAARNLSASMIFGCNHSVDSGTVRFDSVTISNNRGFSYVDFPTVSIGGSGQTLVFTDFWEQITPDDLGNEIELKLKLRDDVTGTYSLDHMFLYGWYLESPSVHLRRDLSLVSGRPYDVRIEGTTEPFDDAVSFMFGSDEIEEDWPTHDNYVDYINQGCAEKVVGDFVIQSTMVPDNEVFNLSYQPAYGSGSVGFANGAVRLTRVRITEQSPGNKSYKSLIPHVVTTAGYTTSEVDQPLIDTHADEYGDPELGWLVTKNESADQVLFRLAGSLFGYVWHGLDGKVRSKKLEAPGPVDDPFVINSTNCDPAQIIAYDDEAPNLRKAVNALRNWQPLDADSTAGITTTWTEADRAAVIADWRITRAWEMGADGKEEFTRRWPNVASREPLATALRDAVTAQLVANQGPDQWIDRPMFYEVPVKVPLGDLSKVAVGETVKAELDYPGLEDDWLLVLGRSGGAQTGMVNLTLWKAGVLPVTLLAPYRFDPRITFTRDSEATYFDSDGVLQTAAVDVARLDYDPADDSVKGWLFEEERTNELLDNRDLTTGNWSGSNGGTATRDAVGLDGVENSASTVSGTAQNSLLQQTVTVPADTNTHRAYVYAKKNQSTACEFRVVLGGINRFVRVDTTDGSIVTGTGTVEGAGGWWRLSIEIDGDGSDTALVYRLFNDRSGSNVDQAFDFGQVELNAPYLTSAIENEGTAVTRSADSALIDGDNFTTLWNADEGTLVVEVTPQSDEDGTILDVSDGTSDERILINIMSGQYRARIVRGGSTVVGIIAGAASAGTKARLVLAYKENDVAFYQDGALQGTDASAAMPAVTQLEWGTGFHVSNTSYYARRLTDDQLEAASETGRDLIRNKI